MEDGENFFIVFSKILAEDVFIDSFYFKKIVGDGLWGIFLDDIFFNEHLDGSMWVFVEF